MGVATSIFGAVADHINALQRYKATGSLTQSLLLLQLPPISFLHRTVLSFRATMNISSHAKAQVNSVLSSVTEKPNGIPGIIYIAMNKEGKVLFEGAAGVRSLATPTQKMTTDTLCFIASCIKLVTTMACLQLVEQGKVTLDDPAVIENILPEVAAAKMIEGSKEHFTFKTPTKKITLKMLLNHSSGFFCTVFDPQIRDFVASHNVGDEFSGTIEPYLLTPLVGEPGEDWRCSIGVDWAGILVERVTGLTLGDYFSKHIFEPLGLNNIHFGGQKGDVSSRLAGLHFRDSTGTLSACAQLPSVTSATFHSGGMGLVSTASDYLQILTSLINEGVGYNGARILKAETVQKMFENSLTPELTAKLDNPVVSARPEISNTVPNMQPEDGGLSFLLTQEELPTGRSADSAWWAGVENCYYTVDRKKGIVTMILSQVLPFADLTALGTWAQAELELYKGLTIC